jgi:hypothetical protein
MIPRAGGRRGRMPRAISTVYHDIGLHCIVGISGVPAGVGSSLLGHAVGLPAPHPTPIEEPQLADINRLRCEHWCIGLYTKYVASELLIERGDGSLYHTGDIYRT